MVGSSLSKDARKLARSFVVQPSAADRALNQYGLVAVGDLVGVFSKNAVEKLREVFAVLFRTGEQSRAELLDRLPAKLRVQVEPYLSSGASQRRDA